MQQFLYSELCALEDDVKQLQQNLRFRRVNRLSSLDGFEMSLALEKLEYFTYLNRIIRGLLKLEE